MLVSVLRAASQLDMLPSDHVLRSLQTEALWRIRRFSYKQLAFLMEWAVTEQERLARMGHGQGEASVLANEVAKQLELRWTELSEPKTVSMLMSKATHLPPSLIEKLEDKVHAHTHTNTHLWPHAMTHVVQTHRQDRAS